MAEESYGRNGLSAKKAFEQAHLYIGNFPWAPRNTDPGVFPSAMHSFRHPKGRFYGLIDSNEDIIMLNEKFLKPFPESNKTEYALNFVVDAFLDLKEALSFGRGANKVKGSPYQDLVVKKGWVDYNKTYNVYMSKIYETFSTNFLQQKNRHKCVRNIDHFLNKFFNDFMKYMRGTTITRSSFLLSEDPAISGLVIEISDDDHGHDLTKWRKWISSPAFHYFRSVASKYGFYVDLYAPWRLVANLASPNMKAYMKKYKIKDAKQLFSRYYVKAYRHDIENLKLNLFEMYKDFLTMSSGFFVPKTSSEYFQFGAKTITSNNTTSVFVTRQPIELKDFLKKYNNNYWFEKYIDVRLRDALLLEEGRIQNATVDKVLHHASELNKHVDFNEALVYINDYIKSRTKKGPGNMFNLIET